MRCRCIIKQKLENSGSSKATTENTDFLITEAIKKIQEKYKSPDESAISLDDTYLLKVNNENNRTLCKVCPKLTIKTAKQRHWRRCVIFIVHFEHISHIALVLPLLTWSKLMPVESVATDKSELENKLSNLNNNGVLKDRLSKVSNSSFIKVLV